MDPLQSKHDTNGDTAKMDLDHIKHEFINIILGILRGILKQFYQTLSALNRPKTDRNWPKMTQTT